MEWRLGRRAYGAASLVYRPAVLLAAACAFALAACQPQGQSDLSAAQPRGASVAFDSIDGLPQAQFRTLVQDLNEGAQARRLAVISRKKPSAYRVRGYLAADIIDGKTKVFWVWDVFDRNEHRALRISGSEFVGGNGRTGWAAVDKTTLHRIADSSINQLAAFLTSPAVAPGAAPARLALAAEPPASSPEAAGIFRIFHAHADPVPDDKASAPVQAPSQAQVPSPSDAGSVVTSVSAGVSTTLSARAIY